MTSQNSLSEILIVLDLDETLVYAVDNRLSSEEDFKVADYFVYKRPYLDYFLQELMRHFKVGIWSSGSDEYVEEIVRNIVPPECSFGIVWGRSHCFMKKDFETDGYYYEKKLSKLKRKGFTLEKIIIVDDSPEKVRKNYGNAVFVKEFVGDSGDNELLALLQYLISLKDVENVRAIETRQWSKSRI